jgi:isoaspartyl peptidase/L-asparaginase-like protein (Ntn-hydrolase superfamily)
MHGPKKRAGAVAALEGVRTPSLVAKAVMENTDHHLLVGHDAQRFARQMGFTVEDDLNTPESRRLWLEWKRRLDPAHFLDPERRAQAGHEAGLRMVDEGLIDPHHYYGTINCNAINARGDICGATTTSGLAWKIPGRTGDSPILGAGLYVDNEVGAAHHPRVRRLHGRHPPAVAELVAVPRRDHHRPHVAAQDHGGRAGQRPGERGRHARGGTGADEVAAGDGIAHR